MNHKSGMHGQMLKISKKLLGRTFTLGMILDYCTKHTNHTSAPPIISMLNVFLRNSGNSTQEERDIIDQVEYKLLNNEVDDIRFFEDLINEDQLQEDDMEEPGDCFKFMNDFIKQKVETVVNTYYQGSAANLALIEIVFLLYRNVIVYHFPWSEIEYCNVLCGIFLILNHPSSLRACFQS